jgi:hypothetical protein
LGLPEYGLTPSRYALLAASSGGLWVCPLGQTRIGLALN